MGTRILLSLLVVLCIASSARAFGAGEIPATSAVSKFAYRHGTIEQVLENLAKVAARSGDSDVGGIIKGVAGAFLGGGGVGSLTQLIGQRGGEKFTGLDVKRVYFGNWLRDYSQACDTAGLSKLSADSIVLLIMCLGFMSFGYATNEFEVTKERLGVYLCTEHIDNPKGYPSDAQQYDDRLRPPVRDQELEIDPRNGMKAYIASEGRGFDTSTECIRGHLRKAIELRRRGDEYGAFRELGTALHTLEDFLAHSNYLELALNKLGHKDVFCHVGDNVRVRAPNGDSVPPIVTGTFGSSDFMVSVLGEVGDKLSSSTVDDLDSKFANARKQEQQNDGSSALLKQLLGKIPSQNKDEGDLSSKIQNVENIKKNAVNIDPDRIATEEAQRVFIEVLTTRDQIFQTIENTLEKIGLDDLIEELSNALTVFVLTTLDPYISPIIKKVKDAIVTGSEAITSQEDQLVVFNDADASDPTHSVLSKDHYDCLLNEAGGKVAIAVVEITVDLVVNAWTHHEVDIDQTIDTVLEAIHHPYFASGRSEVQTAMFGTVREWLESKPRQEQQSILRGLTKESVKEGKNKREDAESYGTRGHRCGPGQHSHGQRPQQAGRTQQGGYGVQVASGYNSATYSRNDGYNHSSGYNDSSSPPGRAHPSIGEAYGSAQYGDGSRHDTEQTTYGRQRTHQTYGGEQGTDNYESASRHGSGKHQSSNRYEEPDSRQTEDRYGRQDNLYGQSRNTYGQTDNSYGREEATSFGRGSSEYSRPSERFSPPSDMYGGGPGRSEHNFERQQAYGEERAQEHDQPSYGRASGREGFGGRDERREEPEPHRSQQSFGYHGRENVEAPRQHTYGTRDDGFEGRMGQMNLGGNHEERYGDEGRGHDLGRHGREDNQEETESNGRFGGGEGRHHGGPRGQHGFGGGDADDNEYGRRRY